MLPAQHSLGNSQDFSRVITRGVKAGSRSIVVYRHRRVDDVCVIGGPRCGLIVSKAVGNSVMRHRVSRRLRHIFMAVKDDMDSADEIVIRALPRVATQTSAELEKELRRALERTRRKEEARERKSHEMGGAGTAGCVRGADGATCLRG